MYVPAHFAENRTEILHDLIEKNPLGILVTNGAGGLDANHIPFELDKGRGSLGALNCHVARANPIWQDITAGDEVLVVFRAAHGYISPGWYPSKHEFKKQVPSWNYLVVHAYGRATIHDDEIFVRGLVARLTRTHETKQAKPWKMTDSPKDFIDTMLTKIVGINIDITRLIGKFKLSQNKELRDILGAGHALVDQGDEGIGDAMLAYAANKAKQN